MKVRYIWLDSYSHVDEDLICEVTEFMNQYLIYKPKVYKQTYLYNDLNKNEDGTYRISFRYPGSTRGSIQLERINSIKFKILKFNFIYDTSFGEFGIYKRDLEKDIKKYIGEILDFSAVYLNNNR